VSVRPTKPGQIELRRAREEFRALLERKTKEAEWQRFFAQNPYVLSMSLPLRLDPTDIVPMARPGRTEPDFVFYPQNIRPVPFYGIIELKRPDTRIFTVTRKNVAVLSRDAQTAIQQAHTFATNPGGLVPIERPDKMLFLGNIGYTFVIMGMSEELTLAAGIEMYSEMTRRTLPGNLRILGYDEVLRNFERGLAQHTILVLVPAQERPPFEFKTVTLDSYGAVLREVTGEATQIVEELATEVALELVEIPGGTFVMGSPDAEEGGHPDERPQHSVTVSPFQIGKFPVTQAQWRVVAGWPKVHQEIAAEPSSFKGDERPVEQVSWKDAVEFCSRLSHKSGKSYRLPSEAEWEYACRAGTETPFAFGETITLEFVNYDGNHPYGGARKGLCREQTIPVGSLGAANRFGLYDMHGNVWEWCRDAWHKSYNGAPSDGRAWEAGGEPYRVLRGGSWLHYANVCRSGFRLWYDPGLRNYDIGFRIVVVSRIR
jgi:formylglycine-generating enzyme required for sulfatase activity